MKEEPDKSKASQHGEAPLPPAPRVLDLRELGIDKEQAADLRWRLSTFAEDWERPEMDVYDVD